MDNDNESGSEELEPLKAGDQDDTPWNNDAIEEQQTAKAIEVVKELHERFEKAAKRREDYFNLFSFILFVILYLAVLYMQRDAALAYQVHSTVASGVVPEATYFDTSSDVLSWLQDLLKSIWKDPACGDGNCEEPFEFSSYGRFGCRADCGKLQEKQNLTTIQLDVYYKFNHPIGSVPSTELMQQAAWNLCPKNGTPHGKDCYWDEDRKFDRLDGIYTELLEDVPDGNWEIRVKRDWFSKISVAVRKYPALKAVSQLDKVWIAYQTAIAESQYEKQVLQDTINELGQSNNKTFYDYVLAQKQAEQDSYAVLKVRDPDQFYLKSNATEDKFQEQFNNYNNAIDFCVGLKEKYELTEPAYTQGLLLRSPSEWDSQSPTYTNLEICQLMDTAVNQTLYQNFQNIKGKVIVRIDIGTKGKLRVGQDKRDAMKTALYSVYPERYDFIESAKGIRVTDYRTAKLDELTRYFVNGMTLDTSDGYTNLNAPSVRALVYPDDIDELAIRCQERIDEIDEILVDLSKASMKGLDINEMQSIVSLPSDQEFNLFPIKELQKAVDEIQEQMGPDYEVISAMSNEYYNYDLYDSEDKMRISYPMFYGGSERFKTCDLERRAPQYDGQCVPQITCKRSGDEKFPYICPSNEDLEKDACVTTCDRQDDCKALCECDITCGATEFCECSACQLNPASQDAEYKSILDVALESAVEGAKRRRLEQQQRKLKELQEEELQKNQTRNLQQADSDILASLLDEVQSLQQQQSGLSTMITDLTQEVQEANQQAEEQARDTTLKDLIEAGRADIKQGQEQVEVLLQEIIGKQKKAYEAAEQAQAALAVIGDLADQQKNAMEAVQKAVDEQISAIKYAAKQQYINTDQALELWKRARRDQLQSYKVAELSNIPCKQSQVVGHVFAVNNYGATNGTQARERNVGLNNRVIAGLLLYQTRIKFSNCSHTDRFDKIQFQCANRTQFDDAPYGVDPVFKSGTTLYNPDLDNEEKLVQYYSCDELYEKSLKAQNKKPTYELLETIGNGRIVNKKPYCAELFNKNNVPFGFQAVNIDQYSEVGYPVWFDINLSENGAQTYFKYLEEGLYIDRKTNKMSVQLITYNAELKMFTAIKIIFSFTEGGSIQVQHKLHTMRIEMYINKADIIRLVLELVLTVILFFQWLYHMFGGMLKAQIRDGNFLSYFKSTWTIINMVSTTLMVLCTIWWWWYVFNPLKDYDIDIKYDVYADLQSDANMLRWFDLNGHSLRTAIEPFILLDKLVNYMAWYYALNGINILLLIIRILKLMDFQPRLGVVTRSLALAGPDLVHFCLVCGMVFTGYAMMAHLIFGNSIQGFSTFGKAVDTCFEILLGEISVNQELKQLTGLQAVAGTLFFWTFELLVFMVLLNFLLAIIVDAFSEVKSQTSETVGLHTELMQIMGERMRVWFGRFFNNHYISEKRLSNLLKQWVTLDNTIEKEDEEQASQQEAEKKIKLLNNQHIGVDALKAILLECGKEAPQLGKIDVKEGLFSKKQTIDLSDDSEIERAALTVVQRFGQSEEEAEQEQKEEALAALLAQERENLAQALERLADVQMEIAEGQRNIMDGQKRLAEQQAKIVQLMPDGDFDDEIVKDVK